MFIEMLENRQLLSVTPFAAESTTIAGDKANITAQRAKIVVDTKAGRARLAADRAGIGTARATARAAITAARNQLERDRGNPILVNADQAGINAAKAGVTAAVAAARAQVAVDNAGLKELIANDRVALKQLQTKLNLDRRLHL